MRAAGWKNGVGVDGVFMAYGRRVGLELTGHSSLSCVEMQEWGDDMSQFDVIVGLSPAGQRTALELTRYYHLDVEYWPILDPTGLGESRDAKLAAYRQARDQIRDRMIARFGPPTEETT